ncbi:YIP1 family protein [Anaeromicropila populeti]|uniref:Yip1 domain-containing protein n=1 Tax=Anaeromicropila populeti TaxID=37658 RepID=A0A1I6L0B0_9FIRM|nr:YIP1 family protein [Anaeromicropila populeti]SFR96916.1 Yip1 domain-containing protein [Anaeromicropila populeti]
MNILYQSIFAPLGVFNNNYVKYRFQTAMIIVLSTAVLETILAPIIYFCTYRNRYKINLDISSMFLRLVVVIITWVVVCTVFWMFSKYFHKRISFSQTVSIWGLSYIPNFLCIILYNILLIKPEIYNGSGFSTFIISSLFIMFLIWKAIYYFMYMRSVLNTTLREITIITVVSALLFVSLIVIEFMVGVQVPVL